MAQQVQTVEFLSEAAIDAIIQMGAAFNVKPPAKKRELTEDELVQNAMNRAWKHRRR